MKASVEKLEKYNRRNQSVIAYKALYSFLQDGQEENLEKWIKYTPDLSDHQRLEQKKKFTASLKNKNFTNLVIPLVNASGQIVRWHESFAISSMNGSETCEIDTFEPLKRDLSPSDILDEPISTALSLIQPSQNLSDLSLS